MKTFDEIQIKRPALAASYLLQLEVQPGRPLAVFAPRRVGKTFFLQNDLMPAALGKGLLPIYADVWLHKSIPLEAINHALEEALDTLIVPTSATGKLAKTTVKKVSVLGSGLDFGDSPQSRPLPDVPSFRFDSLLDRLYRQHGNKILLLLDEAQALGVHPASTEILASLRAALTKHSDKVYAVFTGSSQNDLTLMFSTAGAPMYQYAQTGDFPFLGEEFLSAISARFSQVHPDKVLSIEALGMLFTSIGHKPALLRDIVKAMSAEGIVDVEAGFNLYINSPAQVHGWNALLDQLDGFDRALIDVVARGLAPLGKEARLHLAALTGVSPTPAKIRAAIAALIKMRLMAKQGTATVVDDELFAAYIRGQDAEITRQAIELKTGIPAKKAKRAPSASPPRKA